MTNDSPQVSFKARVAELRARIGMSEDDFMRRLAEATRRDGQHIEQRLTAVRKAYSRWDRDEPHGAYRSAVAKIFEITDTELMKGPSSGSVAAPVPPFTHIQTLKLSDDEFDHELVRRVEGCSRFVNYSRISDSYRGRGGNELPGEFEIPGFLERVQRGEIVFNRLEVFFSPRRFAKAVYSSYQFKDCRGYETRYYLKNIKGSHDRKLPALNYRSFDDEVFLLGGYQTIQKSKNDYALVFHKLSPLTSFFTEYWNYLWEHALPLWEEDFINADDVAETLDKMKPEIWANVKRAIINQVSPAEFDRVLEELRVPIGPTTG